MKNLILIRHAKSSWANPMLGDKERPLKKRGRREAFEMGMRLFKKGIIPDLILSSPALRAVKTAKRIAKRVGYCKGNIQINEAIYFQGEQAMLDLIAELKVDSVFLIGHNPDLTHLANRLTDDQIDEIPTCGIVSIELPDWHETRGVVRFIEYPNDVLTHESK